MAKNDVRSFKKEKKQGKSTTYWGIYTVWADGYTLVDLILEANHEEFILQTPPAVVVSASPRPASAHLLSCAGAEEQKQGRSVASDVGLASILGGSGGVGRESVNAVWKESLSPHLVRGLEEAEEEFPLWRLGSHLSAVTQEGGRDLSICKPPSWAHKLALARFLWKAQKLLAWAKVLIGLVVPLNKWYNGRIFSHSPFHKQTWEESGTSPTG